MKLIKALVAIVALLCGALTPLVANAYWQSIAQQSVGGNTNAVTGIPNVTQLEGQAALVMSGRVPGGTAFRTAPNTVYASASNSNGTAATAPGERTMSRWNRRPSGASNSPTTVFQM